MYWYFIRLKFKMFYLHRLQLNIKKSKNIKFFFSTAAYAKICQGVAAFKVRKKSFTKSLHKTED